MTMAQPILITAALTLIGLIVLISLYRITERKKKSAREAELVELKELLKAEVNNILTKVQTRMQESTNQTTDKFDALAKDVRTAQDQANAKINSGFEQLQSENATVRRDIAEKITEIRIAFKDYSESVKENLNKYSNDNAEFRREAEHLKERIQRELQNILKEIKSPLDLD
jgi:DNA anti-recombination protein RmuC